jgi:hypothetical protein
MTKIIHLPVITRLDVPVDKVLEGAMDHDLKRVIVLGENNTGEIYFASSQADGGDVMWLMECAKHALITGSFPGDDE